MDMMAQLEAVKLILIESTVFLCENLYTDQVLRHLMARRAITNNDSTHIKAKITEPDRVEKLLDILRKKPVSSYETFMEILRQQRPDLHKAVKKIERKHYGETGKTLNLVNLDSLAHLQEIFWHLKRHQMATVYNGIILFGYLSEKSTTLPVG